MTMSRLVEAVMEVLGPSFGMVLVIAIPWWLFTRTREKPRYRKLEIPTYSTPSSLKTLGKMKAMTPGWSYKTQAPSTREETAKLTQEALMRPPATTQVPPVRLLGSMRERTQRLRTMRAKMPDKK